MILVVVVVRDRNCGKTWETNAVLPRRGADLDYTCPFCGHHGTAWEGSSYSVVS